MLILGTFFLYVFFIKSIDSYLDGKILKCITYLAAMIYILGWMYFSVSPTIVNYDGYYCLIENGHPDYKHCISKNIIEEIE